MQEYRISYRIQFYDDGLPNADEVYYNLIGTDWDTTIDHVSFSVTLPKSFDPGTLGFSTGALGSSGYDPASLTFRVDGTTITGEVSRRLGSYEAVTMRVQLQQGYFKIPFQGSVDVALLVGISAFVLLAFVLFLLYGRDKKIVKTVEFYAPEGLTPAEVGYIFDGVVDNRDVVSLVIYWAHRGYLAIDDTGGSAFQLRQLREIADDAADFEKHMFKGLFKNGPVATSSDLKNTFYKTIASTTSMINKSFDSDKRRVFTKTSMALRPLISFLTALPRYHHDVFDKLPLDGGFLGSLFHVHPFRHFYHVPGLDTRRHPPQMARQGTRQPNRQSHNRIGPEHRRHDDFCRYDA